MKTEMNPYIAKWHLMLHKPLSVYDRSNSWVEVVHHEFGANIYFPSSVSSRVAIYYPTVRFDCPIQNRPTTIYVQVGPSPSSLVAHDR